MNITGNHRIFLFVYIAEIVGEIAWKDTKNKVEVLQIIIFLLLDILQKVLEVCDSFLDFFHCQLMTKN